MGEILELQDSSAGSFSPPVRDAEDWLDSCRNELDHYYEIMKDFTKMDPSEVFQSLSAFTARASELRTRLSRSDTRRATAMRTKEIEPFLEECDRQFKFHSRLTAIREMEWRIEGNGRYT